MATIRWCGEEEIQSRRYSPRVGMRCRQHHFQQVSSPSAGFRVTAEFRVRDIHRLEGFYSVFRVGLTRPGLTSPGFPGGLIKLPHPAHLGSAVVEALR